MIYSYLALSLCSRHGFARDAWAGKVLFEKAVLGKPCTLEKNFLHMKCSSDHLVSDELNQKKFPLCLDGHIWWKLGWIYCFFTLKVHCTYSKHCKILKLTEYVARPIFKHPVKFQVLSFRGKKVMTVYLTPHPRRDFVLWRTEYAIACALQGSTYSQTIAVPRLDYHKFCNSTSFMNFNLQYIFAAHTANETYLDKIKYGKTTQTQAECI